MGKKLAKYLAAGVVAKIGMELYARNVFEEKIGCKIINMASNYFKNYNFKRFVEDSLHVVAWPIASGAVIIGGEIIEHMPDEEFYQKYPQYEKYRKK